MHVVGPWRHVLEVYEDDVTNFSSDDWPQQIFVYIPHIYRLPVGETGVCIFPVHSFLVHRPDEIFVVSEENVGFAGDIIIGLIGWDVCCMYEFVIYGQLWDQHLF